MILSFRVVASLSICGRALYFLVEEISTTELNAADFDEIDSDVKSITYLLFVRTELFEPREVSLKVFFAS